MEQQILIIGLAMLKVKVSFYRSTLVLYDGIKKTSQTVLNWWDINRYPADILKENWNARQNCFYLIVLYKTSSKLFNLSVSCIWFSSYKHLKENWNSKQICFYLIVLYKTCSKLLNLSVSCIWFSSSEHLKFMKKGDRK